MLEGRLPEATLRDAILVSTRRYAKRQETWFRNQLRREQGARSREQEVWMLDATEGPDVLAQRILARWSNLSAPYSVLPAP